MLGTSHRELSETKRTVPLYPLSVVWMTTSAHAPIDQLPSSSREQTTGSVRLYVFVARSTGQNQMLP